MEKDIHERLEKIEKQISDKRKNSWGKIEFLTPALIPLAIAFVGWYYTNQNNENQLLLQQKNIENQQQIALINSTVGQSSLIKDFIPHLNSKDTSERNIAMIAILYAAPAPGKDIIDIIANSANDQAREFANNALVNKRNDLLYNLFSHTKHDRLIAANEIISNWSSEPNMMNEMIQMATHCLGHRDDLIDCENGTYNVIVLLHFFPTELLLVQKKEIVSLINMIPDKSEKTLAHCNALIDKMK